MSQAASSDWASIRSDFVLQALRVRSIDLPKLSGSNRRKATSFTKAFTAKPARSITYDATVVPWMRKLSRANEHLMAVGILSKGELVMGWLSRHSKVMKVIAIVSLPFSTVCKNCGRHA